MVCRLICGGSQKVHIIPSSTRLEIVSHSELKLFDFYIIFPMLSWLLAIQGQCIRWSYAAAEKTLFIAASCTQRTKCHIIFCAIIRTKCFMYMLSSAHPYSTVKAESADTTHVNCPHFTLIHDHQIRGTLNTGTPVEDGVFILKLLRGVSRPEIQLGLAIYSECDPCCAPLICVSFGTGTSK